MRKTPFIMIAFVLLAICHAHSQTTNTIPAPEAASHPAITPDTVLTQFNAWLAVAVVIGAALMHLVKGAYETAKRFALAVWPFLLANGGYKGIWRMVKYGHNPPPPEAAVAPGKPSP